MMPKRPIYVRDIDTMGVRCACFNAVLEGRSGGRCKITTRVFFPTDDSEMTLRCGVRDTIASIVFAAQGGACRNVLFLRTPYTPVRYGRRHLVLQVTSTITVGDRNAGRLCIARRKAVLEGRCRKSF
jgi:hypothetical protein